MRRNRRVSGFYSKGKGKNRKVIPLTAYFGQQPKRQVASVITTTQVSPKIKHEDAFIYWQSLTPLQRYAIMKEVGGREKSLHQRHEDIMDYIEKNDLIHKRPVKPKPEQPIQTQVNPKPQVIIEAPSKPAFTLAKTYANGGQSYEVLEQEYINHQIEMEKKRVKNNIKYYQDIIKNIDNKDWLEDHYIYIGPRSRQKKIEEYDFWIKTSQRRLERLETKEGKAQLEQNYKTKYIELIKDSIKHGKPVPDEVAEQRPEFQVAMDNRRRYEKGLHTSFANKSAAVNAVMFLEKGYKVKRQDGKEIKPNQVAEIDKGITDIQQATGPTKEIMQKSDLTIAHTSGKYPFLKIAGGLYHPNERTITMGIFGIKSLAHEWGHWLDHEAGKQTRNGYEFYTDGRTSRRVKSYKTALSKDEEYSNPLFHKASWEMNDRRALRKLQSSLAPKNYKDLTPEEKQTARETLARVGKYWDDPREIFARLTEQYVAEQHGQKTAAAESPEYYRKHFAYWNENTFNELKPMVKAEIERRIQLAKDS